MLQKFSSLCLCALLSLLAFISAAQAHQLQVEPVVVTIRPQTTFLSVTMSGNGEDIVQAIQVTDAEREGYGISSVIHPRLEKYVAEHFQLRQNGQVLRPKIVKFEYYRPDPLDYKTSKFDVIFRYERPKELAEGQFEVKNSLFNYLPNAQTILSVGGLQKTLNPGESVTYDPTAVAANLWRNVKDFTIMGAEHIFTGPDHMLFILALLLVSTSLWPLIKTLTGFTIAHSITLILSALSVVVLPNHLVDILIAVSIIYVGLENIFWKNAARHRFFLAAAFGLVHGFGFSYTLREIGLPQEGLWLCLLSFNLGVEIAQVILCAVAFPVMLALKRKLEHEAQYGGMGWPKAVAIGSWAVVAMGGFWLVQRLTGA